MQEVLQKMIVSMELKGFAKSTQRAYLGHIRRFSEFCEKHPDSAGYDEVRAFLHHAIKVRELSAEYVNSAYSAIKFLYQSVFFRECLLTNPLPHERFKVFSKNCPFSKRRCPAMDRRTMLTNVHVYFKNGSK